jgi:hypothetical protein
VFFGPIEGAFGAEDADVIVIGEEPVDYLGSSVAWAGDLDGDTREDLLIGANGLDPDSGSRPGGAYLELGASLFP